ncbi:FAD-dependent oxidoreductase [Novipirellula artificiosorum]|uniref:Putative FAD-binding dehydrogenase n=1 Tax=Novipirellula artificiosorum TaxID=2528016 RepID=A0A5C6D7M6_9BACT|nr:FAD-dependent oxidoreductase [Novipirellula artificiosorum]TWU33193.1 putative FAD-binding dehydrogenase [Novipirellula artificiosorum]
MSNTLQKQGRRTFLKQATLLPAAAGLVGAVGAQAAQPNRRPASLQTDVLVVGGGPAGIGAAIGAAKAGAKTLVLEDEAFFGGVAAWGVGMCMNQMRPFSEPRGFVHELLLEKLQAYGDQAVRLETHQFFVNVEYLKAAVLDALDEVGCTYLVHAKAVEAITEGDQVKGVVISTKSGLQEIRANVVVDCTGDADIAYFSGAPTLTATGKLSPQTLGLNVGNVEGYGRKDLMPVFTEAREQYPLIPDRWWMHQVSNCNFSYINHSGTKTLGNFDVTDIEQFSKAECLSRKQAVQMVEAMRHFGKGVVKNCELVGTSPRIGVRESRRIEGAYILSEEDALAGRRFDDAIAWRSGWLDIGFTRVTQMKVHQVPYRALLPKQVEGLLVAGRCISATHAGASAGKSMGNCFATGHAAGVAGAMSSKTKVSPRALDVKEIQKRLRQDGVNLDRGGEMQSREMSN